MRASEFLESPTSTLTVANFVTAVEQGQATELLWRRALMQFKAPALLRASSMLAQAGNCFAESAALFGHFCLSRKSPASAVAAFEAALSLGRDSSPDRFSHALALLQLGRQDDCHSLLAGIPVGQTDNAEYWWATALSAYAANDFATALRMLTALQSPDVTLPLGVDPDAVRWMAEYLAAGSTLPVSECEPRYPALRARRSGVSLSGTAEIVVGLLDYKSPELRRASRNVGDPIQTIAMLRHVMRFTGPQWSFDDPDVATAADLMARTWKHEERSAISRCNVHVAIIDRDDPWAAARLHDGREIWLIVNGWFFHKSLGLARALPMPDNVRPLFIGFHLSHANDLTEEVSQYLRQHAPIGCRDWSTVWWLLSCGVEAFFSACPTLTLALPPIRTRGARIAVDLPPDQPVEGIGETMTHNVPQLHAMTTGEAMLKAIDILRRYGSAAEVVTGRLHAYLPCLALGTPVVFCPRDQIDRRFDGLADLDQRGVLEFRERITTILEGTLKRILSRDSRVEIARFWRDATGPAVAEARARLGAGPSREISAPLNRQSRSLSESVAAARPRSVTVALSFDRNLADFVPPLVRSINAHTTANLEYIFLVRGIGLDSRGRLAEHFARERVTIIPMDDQNYSFPLFLAKGTTLSAIDRILLPRLLPNHDRVIYLDVDITVLGDLQELACVQVGNTGIAARPDPRPERATVANGVELVVSRMVRERGQELRRQAAALGDLSARCPNVGVLVLSLARLRETDFTAAALELVSRFGLNAGDALGVLHGSGYTKLAAEWNAMPSLEWVNKPKLVHWCGPDKPWLRSRPIALSDLWRKNVSSNRGVSRQVGKATNPHLPGRLDTHAGYQEHWRQVGNYRDAWGESAAIAARFVRPHTRVLDVGCGRMLLRNYLPPDCHYVPADLIGWSPEVTVVDLDRGEFPRGNFDYIVALGVLEYTLNPARILRQARANGFHLIVSFCHPEPNADLAWRRKRRWINDFPAEELLLHLAESGWAVAQDITINITPEFRQMIYVAN